MVEDVCRQRAGGRSQTPIIRHGHALRAHTGQPTEFRGDPSTAPIRIGIWRVPTERAGGGFERDKGDSIRRQSVVQSPHQAVLGNDLPTLL